MSPEKTALQRCVSFLSQHFWKLFLAFLCTGALYRTSILNDTLFELDRFLAYGGAAVFVLFLGAVRQRVLSRKLTALDAGAVRKRSVSTAALELLSSFVGLMCLVVSFFALFCLISAPAMGVMGYAQFYDADADFLSFLGLERPQSMLGRIALLVGVYVLFSSLGHLGLYPFFTRFRKNLSD